MVEQTSPIFTPSRGVLHRPSLSISLYISAPCLPATVRCTESETVRRNIRLPTIQWGAQWPAVPYPKRQRRTKPRSRHPENALSAAFVRAVAEAGRYCDGQGLYLQVDPSGNRRWIQRLVIGGRRCELGLGGFPLVSLKEARTQAFANRKIARAGGDPLAGKRRTRGAPTFAEAAAVVVEQKRSGWRNPKHAQDWPASLERFVFPRFGQRSVSGGHERRRPRSPGPDLAREAGDRATGPPPHRRRDAVGRGHGVPSRQPVRTGRRKRSGASGAWSDTCVRCLMRRSPGPSRQSGRRERPPRPSWRSSSWC